MFSSPRNTDFPFRKSLWMTRLWVFCSFRSYCLYFSPHPGSSPCLVYLYVYGLVVPHHNQLLMGSQHKDPRLRRTSKVYYPSEIDLWALTFATDDVLWLDYTRPFVFWDWWFLWIDHNCTPSWCRLSDRLERWFSHR